jgi:phytoene dehydrogenase-like protein
MADSDVLIVGGGIAGLSCALSLTERGIRCELLEASSEVGGRVSTDVVDGFLLDRGFQVLLTAYPEAQRALDLGALQLHSFEPGALVRWNGKFHRVVDPWRKPSKLLATVASPVGSLADKLRVGRLRRRVTSMPLSQLGQRPECSTIERLRNDGFSERMIERFFRPFLGGVFLERELSTSSRKFEFVFRMFAQGSVAIPAAGMQAIPRQMAAALPQGTISTGQRVERISSTEVVMEDGRIRPAKAVVVATDPRTADRLLGRDSQVSMHSVTCLYFAAEQPPEVEPILILNGESRGPINNLCVPSQVAPSYSKTGQSLISVTVLDDQSSDVQPIEDAVRDQLTEWYGPVAGQWRHLRTYKIDQAIPKQDRQPSTDTPAMTEGHIVLCGDYLNMASLQGALASGRMAAGQVQQLMAG